jgi:hypothetical protein
MPRLVLLTSVLLAVADISAAAAQSDDPPVLDQPNVGADFQLHVLRNRDTRFVGTHDHVASVPGTDPTLHARLIRRHGVRYVNESLDAIIGPAHDRLVANARDYAKRYNALLLRYLHDHPNS